MSKFESIFRDPFPYSSLNELFGPTNFYNYMNHGYYPSYANLNGYHKAFKHQASLYRYLFDGIPTKNKKLLEIGCGRGGGIDLLSTQFEFQSIEGCDLNQPNIDHCKKHSKFARFKISDAEHLEYKDNQFDIVLNVESSHHYKDLEKFYSEVKRVLKESGVFLYADAFDSTSSADLLLHTTFKKVKKEDITSHVQLACEKDIKNFDKILPDGGIKDFSIALAKRTLSLYKKGKSKYFKYIIYKGAHA